MALSAPLVVSFWFRSAFAWIDPAFASTLVNADGESMGDASLAAIGLTLPFEFLMVAFWVGTSNGLTSRLAAAMGAEQHAKVEQLKRAARRITWGMNGIFLLLAAAIWNFAHSFGLDAEVANQFQIYATILVGGSAFTSFWSILPDSLVKAHQDTKTTMWSGILSATLNASLNALFLFVFGWGIFGIALSTVCGRLAGLTYATLRARQHELRRVAQGATASTAPKEVFHAPIRAILAISIPSGLAYVLMALESQFVNGLLATGPDATSQLAAWSIFDRASRFLAMPLIASSVAMLPLVARRFGSEDFLGIRREIRVSSCAGLLYITTFVLPVAWFAGPWLAGALSDSAATQEAATMALKLLPLAVLAMSPLLQLRAVFDGLQRPKPGLAVALLRSLVFVLPLTAYFVAQAQDGGQLAIMGATKGLILGVTAASVVLVIWLRLTLPSGATQKSLVS